MKSKIEEVTEDLKKIKDLTILNDTPGGKQLTSALTTDIISSIDQIIDGRSTLTLQEFIAIACDIKARLDVVRSIKRSKKNEQFLEELLADLLAQ